MYKAFGVKNWNASRFDKGSNQKFGYVSDIIVPTKKHAKQTKKSVYQTEKTLIGTIRRNKRAKEYEAKMRAKNQSFITRMINMF